MGRGQGGQLYHLERRGEKGKDKDKDKDKDKVAHLESEADKVRPRGLLGEGGEAACEERGAVERADGEGGAEQGQLRRGEGPGRLARRRPGEARHRLGRQATRQLGAGGQGRD
jgi:hypothetical protein